MKMKLLNERIYTSIEHIALFTCLLNEWPNYTNQAQTLSQKIPNPTRGFFCCDFSYPWSTTLWKNRMVNSRNNSRVWNCTMLWVVRRNLAPPALDANHHFVQCVHAVYATFPLITQGSSQSSHWPSWYCSACIQVTTPKPKRSDAGNFILVYIVIYFIFN